MKSFDKPLANCPACDSPYIYLYHTVADNIKVFKCRQCGLQFMNPQYSEKYLGEYYSVYTVDEPWWEEPLLYCHDYYLSIIEKFTTKGKLLDVGAGKGYLMQAAMSRGWEVEGYEIDNELTNKLAEKYKVKMYSGDFAALDMPPELYNAVTMHQVIE